MFSRGFLTLGQNHSHTRVGGIDLDNKLPRDVWLYEDRSGDEQFFQGVEGGLGCGIPVKRFGGERELSERHSNGAIVSNKAKIIKRN